MSVPLDRAPTATDADGEDGPLGVVVVDDDEPLRGLITRLLRADGGFDILGECGDGRDAIEIVMRTSPDIVLLDLCMPGLDGWEVLPAICRDSPRTMVTVLSALEAEGEAEETFAVGAFAYLEKSVLGPGFAEEVRGLRRLFERGLAGETVWVPGGPTRLRR